MDFCQERYRERSIDKWFRRKHLYLSDRETVWYTNYRPCIKNELQLIGLLQLYDLPRPWTKNVLQKFPLSYI